MDKLEDIVEGNGGKHGSLAQLAARAKSWRVLNGPASVASGTSEGEVVITRSLRR